MRKGIKPFLGVCAFCLCAFPLTHADAKTIVGEKEYSDLNTAIKEIGAQEATFKITEDETTAMSISIPAGANYTIDGGNNKVSYSFNLDAEAAAVEHAVTAVLDAGWRTADIAGTALESVRAAGRLAGTKQMGDLVIAAL